MRGYLPGDGKILLEKWVKAVKYTGFEGVYSVELLGPKYWEWDLLEIARETKERMENYLY